MTWVSSTCPKLRRQWRFRRAQNIIGGIKKYFFDSRHQDPARFARWSRIPDLTDGGKDPHLRLSHRMAARLCLSLHEVAVLCGISSKFLRGSRG
jgi:hypothetical protein